MKTCRGKARNEIDGRSTDGTCDATRHFKKAITIDWSKGMKKYFIKISNLFCSIFH